MKFFLPVLFILFACKGLSQSKRIVHWYFGWEAGIDFSSGVPVADQNGKLVSIEGASTMSDRSGNLLFYSNGEKAWNRNHIVMPDGNGLKGDQSSNQSSIIVPLPGNDNLYYLFTSAGFINSGFYYNVINMNLDGGLGNITSDKNVQLLSEGTEQLAGTMHCNGTDYWIVTRKRKANALLFYAYRLSGTGLHNPVITEISAPSSYWNVVGSLTFSTDGKMLIFSSFETDNYLFDFNTGNGKLTLRNIIARRQNENTYSNAFSPDHTKLYTTSWIPGGFNYLSQFDLTQPDIGASRTDIDSADYRLGTPNGFGYIGQIRLAPDKKIYLSRWNQKYPYQVHPATFYSLDSIDVIHNPDMQGSTCTFQRNFLYLNHKPTMIGLPNFISNFIVNDGIPLTGSAPAFSLGPDLEICNGQTLIIKPVIAGDRDVDYLWQDGSTDTFYTITTPGLYTLELSNQCISAIDSVVVKEPDGHLPVFSLGPDLAICNGQTIIIKPTIASDRALNYLWQDGSTDTFYTTTTPGLYTLELSNQCAGAIDSVVVKELAGPLPAFSLGPDLEICNGQTIVIKPTIAGDRDLNYLWHDGSTDTFYTTRTPGLYTLEISNACTKAIDSIIVKENICELYIPSAFTPNGDGRNDVFKAEGGNHLAKFKMTIYNRWGQKIFESNNVAEGWNGRYLQQLQTPGVYIWSITYDNREQQKQYLKGTITLIL